VKKWEWRKEGMEDKIKRKKGERNERRMRMKKKMK
jgi:hypothetical protein